MTARQTIRQRNEFIKSKFFDSRTLDENDLWRVVYERTETKLKWQIEERVMRMVFIDKKQPYNILKELKIPNIRTYYYYLGNICQIGFLFAKDLKLI